MRRKGLPLLARSTHPCLQSARNSAPPREWASLHAPRRDSSYRLLVGLYVCKPTVCFELPRRDEPTCPAAWWYYSPKSHASVLPSTPLVALFSDLAGMRCTTSTSKRRRTNSRLKRSRRSLSDIYACPAGLLAVNMQNEWFRRIGHQEYFALERSVDILRNTTLSLAFLALHIFCENSFSGLHFQAANAGRVGLHSLLLFLG